MADLGPATTVEHLDPPLNLDGVAYCQIALRHPFVADAPVAEEWRLYVVRGEGAALRAAASSHVDGSLPNGTIIGMGGTLPHRFESDGAPSDQAARPWCEEQLGADVGDADVVITIGRIPQSSMPFLSLMGGFIRIDPNDHPDLAARIGTFIDWIAAETARGDAAADAIVLRIAEIIHIEIGRVGRAQGAIFHDRPRDAEYDPRIWRAIVAVSTDPQQRWTVEAMAEIAGMSRSAFAARYRETIGTTPMKSLRRLRMHRAATSLARPGSTRLAPLAGAMGYGSDAAFCRAFTKEFGHPPKQYGLRGR